MTDEYFKKRPGTTDRGKDYEDLFLTNIILDFILDDDILDFKISSNDESFGAFDDIVLEITWNDERKTKDYYALQLKHSARPLTLKNLTGKSGDFSIKKYFENVLKLKRASYKWVLLTNRTFKHNEREALIRMDGDEFDVKISRYLGEPQFMKFCEKRCFYQFRTDIKFDDDGDSKDNESYICYLYDIYKDFFGKFFLCTDQLDVSEIEIAATNKFSNIFCCDKKVFRDYYKFITDWSLKEGKKVRLNKILMKQVIAIQLLSPFVKTILPKMHIDDQVKPRFELFHEAISQFCVTYLKPDDLENLEKILGERIRNLKRNRDILKDVNIIGMRHQIISKSVKDLYALTDQECNLLFWLVDCCHLVVSEDESVNRAINLCKDKKYIVLRQSDNNAFQDLLVFQKLSDLRQYDVFHSILNMSTCKLQGKQDITLEALLRCSSEIEDIVQTSQLLEMVVSQVTIGENKEDLPVPYIGRSVCRLIVDFKFLAVINIKTLIIIAGLKNSKMLEKYINSDISIINITELAINGFRPRSVYICEECPLEVFQDINEKYENLKCHQFRFEDEKMEWVRSNGGVADLKKFLIGDQFIDELKLADYEKDNNINVICADAGMGKTTLLKKLKNNYSTEFWTILIYPKDHSKYFRENGDDLDKFIQYIFGKISRGYTDFDKRLVKILYKEGLVNFLWDALDETSDENLKIVLSIIDQLSKKMYKQWVSSRSNLESMIENKFSVLSQTIREFDEADQKRYIGDKLKCSENNLEDIFAKVNKNIQLFRYNKILGIPLQIYMFTELLLKDLEKYTKLLDEILSLAYLYECFVDEKFSVLHQEKENFDGNNDMIYRRNEEYKEDRIKLYEEVAMKLHFPAEIVEKMEINCRPFLEKLKTHSDSVGIITHVSDDNVPDFWHNSYGEYFAALYLSKHIKVLSQITKLIFGNKHTNIRFFFDLIMAKEYPAHISVLYKNIDALRNCQEEEITKRDDIGRNPLQLACSWGEHYLDLLPQKSSKWIFFRIKYKVYGVFAESVKEENPEYYDILEELIKTNDPHEKDELFGYNSFIYADQARCLVPLAVLSRKYDLPFDGFENFNDNATILYYASMFDLIDLLNAIKDIPIVEDEFEKSVIFTAVKYGSVNCLKKLISSTYYKHIMLNNKNELLQMAFDNKHYNVAELVLKETDVEVEFLNNLLLKHAKLEIQFLQLLIDNGAKVNITNEDGCSPFYIVCLYQKYENANYLICKGAKVEKDFLLRCCGESSEITKLLIRNGANVNIANKDGKTPIQHASENYYFETVKVLIDHGAIIDDGDGMGCRPIHHACVGGRYDVVKKLLDQGADVNIRNIIEFTPLHYACGQQHDEVVELLLERGAIVDVTGGDGRTPMDYVVSKGNQRIIELLMSAESKKVDEVKLQTEE